MADWMRTLIPQGTSIRDSLEIISKSRLQIGLVVNSQRHLLGVVTDGDIRRGLLKNIDLEAPIDSIMSTRFTSARKQDDRETVLGIMRSKVLQHLPILDNHGAVVGLTVLFDLVSPVKKDNWVVLMAGGLGTRLRPLTEQCPKPLLRVGDRPVLETILLGFRDYGFRKFFLSVNYKADMIEQYFGDGSNFNVEIQYIREDKRMGTAGCLSMLPEQPDKPFFVMNGDLLTRINFEQMLSFHEKNQSIASMGIREYDIEIPFGVVEVDHHQITSLQEKPVHKFFVNAGVYTLSPEVLKYVPANGYLDMPVLFERLLKDGQLTTAFPIHEYWLDIGRIGDYHRANGEFSQHFSSSMTKGSKNG